MGRNNQRQTCGNRGLCLHNFHRGVRPSENRIARNNFHCVEFRKLGVFATFLALFLSTFSYAQVTTSSAPPYDDPAYLINNVLLGSGVQALNITYYGDTSLQLGYFNAVGSGLGVDSGIVLTTGDIASIPINGIGGQPIFGPNSGGFGPPYMGNQFDNNLLDVSASVPGLLGLTFPPATGILDASVLEFDFIPSSDTVEFTYVFASLEWNAFPCTQFNDVFGFFVSGPGLNGSFNSPVGFPDSAINVAFVPGTNPEIPITISSIHPGGNNCGTNPLNDQYYIDNQPNVDVTFNGYTVVLTAKFATVACDTYHIALAIGDGTDPNLDSGVFLEAKSFSAQPVEVSAVPSFNTFGNDSNLYEGCGNVELVFERFADISSPFTLHYSIGGTATNGVDYTFLPDSVQFAAGQNITSLNFLIFDDVVIEGQETLILTLPPDSTSCNPGDTQVVTLYINDRPPLVASPINDTITCLDDSATLNILVSSGIPDYTFIWGTGDTTMDSLNVVAPVNDSVFLVTITDACGIDTLYDSVFAVHFNPPLVVVTQDDTLNCTNDSLWIWANVVSGSGEYNYVWSTGDTTDSVYVGPTSGTTYFVTVTDACDTTVWVDSVRVILFDPPLQFTLTDDTINCLESPYSINVNILSGTSPHTFSWSNGMTGNPVVVNITQTETFSVTVSDQCMPSAADSVTITVQSPPLIVNPTVDTMACINSSITLGVDSVSGSLLSYLWGNGATTDSITVSPTQDTTYMVTITDACDTTVVVTSASVVLIFGDPMALDILSDTITCPGDTVTLTAIPGGGIQPYSYNWDNTGFQPVYRIAPGSDTTYHLTVTDVCGVEITDSIDVLLPLIDSLGVSLVYDSVFCSGKDNLISAVSLGGVPPVAFNWFSTVDFIPGTGPENIVINTNQEASVSVSIQDACGQVAADTALLVPEVCERFIPNIITPNGDFINDFFDFVDLSRDAGTKLIIYNRWGLGIYETNDYRNNWAGEFVSDGVYFYTVVFPDGETVHGNFTIIH